MIVQHNLLSCYASREYKKTSKRLEDNSEKLSTGYRINQAKDDAAGLAISEKMRKMIRGLEQGINNTQDAISMLQVADGALNEVDDILKRFKELTVKASTDTNTDEDRAHIQDEINELNALITQIGKYTEFNTIPVFDLPRDAVTKPSTTISFEHINLVEKPFDENTEAGKLNFKANVNKNGVNEEWDLIYCENNTNTSTMTLQVTYNKAGVQQKDYMDLKDCIPTNYTYDESTKTSKRDYVLDYGDGVQFTVTEIMKVGAKNTDSQYYDVSYVVKNTGTVEAKTDFLISADTAYNSDDRAESYYVNGQKVDKFMLYTDNQDYKNNAPNYTTDRSNFDTSAGFSIINTQSALPFTENIKFTGKQPDSFGFIEYNGGNCGDLANYEHNINSLFPNATTNNKDLTFTAIWNDTLAANASTTYSYSYGILSIDKDTNVDGVDITYDPIIAGADEGQNEFWIQSGDDTNEGIFIYIDRMNAKILGTDKIEVTTRDKASKGINIVDKAQTKLNKMRSNIGAYQNRLEHIKDSNAVAKENVTASESIIRDTNMAEIMLDYSANNIILQAQTSILAQSNKGAEMVLSLLNQ